MSQENSGNDPALTTVFVDNAAKRRLKKARVVVAEGPDKGKDIVIDKERTTIGRSVICDLVLSDKAVSTTHVELVAKEKGFLLRDLGSTNGTFVGDLRIQEVWVKPGTVVKLGTSHLRFEPVSGSVDIEISKNERFFEIVGRSLRMREIFATLEKVAPTELTVLIRGETGTGKELVARAIHRASRRRDAPMVVQDCSAIPKDLIESTLFGHERGAFTGATDRHRGSFEQADNGTIFLDELGELDLAMQPKLLRVLENREIKRVGGDRQIPVNVRVVAATNRDLRARVNEGQFREDLFYRLSVVSIELPPLRQRPEDIPLLAQYFLDDVAERRFPGENKKFTVTPEAMARLASHPWPGNIRELKNTIERAAALADETEIGVADVLPGAAQKVPSVIVSGGQHPSEWASQFVEEALPFKDAKQRLLDVFEAAYLKALLDKHEGNVTRSAQAAGLTRYHLRELAKKYGVRDVSGDE
ncbi:MAG: sigma 54-interacting transcriptional regulator [Deltaproteobacteria bacterium]|jgi:transcriptional regulator with GAF, ATPase, and Fis domain